VQSIYIIHEGQAKNEDNELLELLVKHLSEEIREINPDMIEYHAMGGKSNFFKTEMYPRLLIQGVQADTVEKILFIIDADYVTNDKVYGGFENTKNKLNIIITQLNLQAVSSVYIMCDPETKMGYLESFILSTIPEQQKNCIESFLACSQFQSKENHKKILNQIYKLAYPNAPYDFSHQHFDELKTKLTQLFVE
jgi:hypothetical protein